MNKLISIVCAIMLIAVNACYNSNDIKKEAFSIKNDQKRIYTLLREFTEKYRGAPNDAARNDIKNQYQQTIDLYLSDTLKGSLLNFSVTIEDIDYLPWNGEIALILKCEHEKVRYYMEQHFANEGSMKKSGLYKFVIGLEEGKDTNISFIYFPKIKIGKEYNSLYDASIEVIPVPDSIAIAYKNKKSLPDTYKAFFIK